MPRYSFAALWPDRKSGEAGSTRLADDDQARVYAHLLIREFRSRPDYREPGLRMIVRNGTGDVLHDIPFLDLRSLEEP